MKRKTRSQRPTEEGWAQEENQITVSEENSRDQVQDSVPDTITQSKTTLALSATFQAPASTPIISVAPSLLNSSALVNSIPTQSNSTFGIRFNALHQLLGDLSNPNHLHSSQLLGSHELADTGKSEWVTMEYPNRPPPSYHQHQQQQGSFFSNLEANFAQPPTQTFAFTGSLSSTLPITTISTTPLSVANSGSTTKKATTPTNSISSNSSMGSTEQPQIVRFNQINPEHPELNSPESPQLRKKTGRSKIKSKNLPKHVTETLKSWLLAHSLHPYPSEDEKSKLADSLDLTINQINNWFINGRRRILKFQSSYNGEPEAESSEGEGETEDRNSPLSKRLRSSASSEKPNDTHMEDKDKTKSSKEQPEKQQPDFGELVILPTLPKEEKGFENQFVLVPRHMLKPSSPTPLAVELETNRKAAEMEEQVKSMLLTVLGDRVLSSKNPFNSPAQTDEESQKALMEIIREATEDAQANGTPHPMEYIAFCLIRKSMESNPNQQIN